MNKIFPKNLKIDFNVLCLIQLFRELQEEQSGTVDRSSDAFQSIKVSVILNWL